jgi:peptidoglycan/LPS O-acetylase OafA/YrhL
MRKLELPQYNYFNALDGLRGIAIFLIVLFHFSRIDFIIFNFEIGWIGVQLFFVLSGFLITRILLREKNKPLNKFLKQFYHRRILRIFPLYYSYILIVVIIYLITNEPADFLINLPYLTTYTYNFTILFADWKLSRLYVHLWSLAVEEQFYIIWPFVIFFLNKKKIEILILVLITFTPIIRSILGFYFSRLANDSPELAGNIIYWISISHFDAFAMGGAINLLGNSFLGITRKLWLYITGILCCVSGIINSVLLEQIGDFDISSLGFPIHGIANSQHVWSYTILNLFFTALVWNLIVGKSMIFNFQPLRLLGKVSYGMYIFHFLILMILDKALKGPLVNEFITFIIYFTICTLVSYTSYTIFEKRFLQRPSMHNHNI